ncbi:flagellar hook-length control protein FliK [Paracoccus aerodenitrificans]|uniref:flagellar hook-length control protein FliK n=1 Tax=Paracoccus aerodenitrificans TaxID=3017781 RepID=UPI0022F0CDEE|nr:flagellar hook-length control protein FliK [Paracoccus aerodenitrificans]WBU63430.1 flagellar hook-length control protein FliK [Paracoccus aerodenitrificans]
MKERSLRANNTPYFNANCNSALWSIPDPETAKRFPEFCSSSDTTAPLGPVYAEQTTGRSKDYSTDKLAELLNSVQQQRQDGSSTASKEHSPPSQSRIEMPETHSVRPPPLNIEAEGFFTPNHDLSPIKNDNAGKAAKQAVAASVKSDYELADLEASGPKFIRRYYGRSESGSTQTSSNCFPRTGNISDVDHPVSESGKHFPDSDLGPITQTSKNNVIQSITKIPVISAEEKIFLHTPPFRGYRKEVSTTMSSHQPLHKIIIKPDQPPLKPMEIVSQQSTEVVEADLQKTYPIPALISHTAASHHKGEVLAPVQQVASAIMQVSATDRYASVILSPDELGHVTFSITQADGNLAITITAERSETLLLLRRNVDQLQSELMSLGQESASFNFHDTGHESDRRFHRADTLDEERTLLEQAQITISETFASRNAASGRLDLRV